MILQKGIELACFDLNGSLLLMYYIYIRLNAEFVFFRKSMYNFNLVLFAFSVMAVSFC